MKTIKSIFATLLMLAIPAMMMAQSPMDAVFEKYNGKDGFTTVKMNKELFALFNEIEVNKDGENVEELEQIKELTEQLEGIRVLSFEPGDDYDGPVVNLYEEVMKDLPKSYVELMSVKDGGEDVKFLIHKKGKKIKELLLLVEEGNSSTAISITGMLDMKNIGKIAQTMNMKGMEKLDKLNDHDEDKDSDSDKK